MTQGWEAGLGAARGAKTWPGWCVAGPAIRPQHDHDTGHDIVSLLAGSAAARAHGLAEEIVAIQNFVLRLGGGLVGRDTARGLAAGLYRETSATRHIERHDMTGVGPATRLRHYQPGLRHDRPQAATRPTTRQWHGRPGRSARGLCVQPGSVGCAPGAPNLVLDSVHCFIHCLDHCA